VANRYVYHGGSNTSPYDTWAKAATTLATAVTGAAAGDYFFIASDHAESTAAAVSWTFTGTAASPCRFISVNRAGSVPPVAADILAGASISTTGNSSITFNGTGSNYFNGISFNAGVGATGTASIIVANSSNAFQVFDNCSLNLASTGTSSRITFGNNAQCAAELSNSTQSFSSVSQGITVSGTLKWTNRPGSAAVTGATIPTTLFLLGGNQVDVLLSGLDLSAFGSGKTLFANAVGQPDTRILNCKLGASVTIAATPAQANSDGVKVIGSHSAGNVRRDELYAYQGTLTTETTIVRTAGATDGVTPFSWKVVTTASPERMFPFRTFSGSLWNDATGSAKTLTIHTVTDNVTLTDAEIWVEVDYLGSSAAPVVTTVVDANATLLSTPANQASDSGEAWTTTGLTTPVKQKLEVTFTPQMAGPIRWRVLVAKPSTTVYIDPNADLS
jgi:hypothetical protein